MRVLLAEDEKKLAAHVAAGLKEAGYTVDTASDGDEAVWLARNHPYDLLILDVMMPSRDGFAVVRELRRRGLQQPVLMLTARAEVEDRVRGLDAGADDYLTKPFSMVELLARVRALLRRQRPEMSNVLRVEDLELDLIARTARRGKRQIPLTNREFALLELLMLASPNVVSRTAIVERVWDQHFDSGTNVVNVYVARLREKLGEPGEADLLHTVRGIGFALKPGKT